LVNIEISNLVHRSIIASQHTDDKQSPKRVWFGLHDQFLHAQLWTRKIFATSCRYLRSTMSSMTDRCFLHLGWSTLYKA